MKISVYNKRHFAKLVDGTSQNLHALSSFRWASTPQGQGYWSAKQFERGRKAATIGHRYVPDEGYVVDGLYDGILTEEDWAFFKVAGRNKRRVMDKFLTLKKNKEYVEYADDLEKKTDNK